MAENGDDRAERLMRARFRKHLLEGAWIAAVSTAFPDHRFDLLAGTPVSDGVVGLGEVVGDEAGAAGEAIRTHPDIGDYDELYADDQRTLARFKWTDDQFFDYLRAASVPPEFPVVVQNGVVEFDVSVTREQFEQVGAALDATDQRYELVSVVSDRESESVLTERQQECLSVALSEGYFRVPRECTLEAVADSIGVDKSTASKTIRRGVERVLEWFLVGSNTRESG